MASRERRDPYVVLGVAPQASDAEIARAYRRAARGSHPDGGSGSAERFRAVRDAYDLLRDPERRAVYDRSHPVARPRAADPPAGSVRYAVPGSQHLVLGRPGPSGLMPPQALADEIQDEREDIESLLRLALSLLRAGW